MKINLNKMPKSIVELTIEINTENLTPFLNKAAKRLSQKNKISGFRPGKTPFNLIEKQLGTMAIYEEAMEEILNDSYFKALKKNQLLPVEKPKIDIIKFAPGNPFIYKAIFAVLPKVKLGDCKKINLKRKEIKITPDQMEKALKELQKMRAKETLVDREIQKGDKAIADLEMFIDKVPLEGGQSKNTQIIIGDSFFIPGFGENLIGLKKNETKEFSLKFPVDHYDKKLSGKTVDFKAKINEVYKIDYPEINDEFIKNLGKFENVEEFKKKLEENLKEEEKHKEEQRLELKILDELEEKSEFEEIPEILIELETDKMILELEANIKQQGIKFEDYLNHLQKTRENLKEELKSKAKKRIKTILLINEIIKQKEIKISDEDIEKAKEETLRAYSFNPELAKNIQTEEYKNYLINLLKNRKAIEFLKSEILK
ncbi:MAG: Trigger factor [Parcubacteria group bacterium Athens0714_12]|nr:MAG: Trigger factor [Parcubacteria group bacterium Athens0714_12]